MNELLKATEEFDNMAAFDSFLTVTADADYMYFPGRPPRPRRHAHKWRDATDEELKQHVQTNVLVDRTDTSFYDEFMRIADPELMKNLNPTILNALQDATKIKKKIYIPKNPGVNYIGLLIGPQGVY